MSSINRDVVSVWNVTMEKLKTVSMDAYTGWFSKTTPLSITDNNVLEIGVSDEFFRDWIRDSFSDTLQECLSDCGYDLAFDFIPGYPAPEVFENSGSVKEEINSSCDIEQGLLFADDPAFNTPAEEVVNPPAEENTIPVSGEVSNTGSVVGLHHSSLNLHTFRTFIVGEENRYAYETIKSVALNPGKVYNPLYIYGGTGVGKTHLLQAVANEAIAHNPKLRIRYVTCEDLLNEFLDLLREHKSMSDFRSNMRNVDIFLVDDVHVLAKSPRTQEEFFNTFNTLYNGRKQIIMTSDKPPCELEGLELRLVSRFESGLTQEISAPEFETRLAILQAIRSNKDIKTKISDDVIEFIAENITSSVRRLKGAFLRVTAYANMHKNISVNVGHVEELLSSLIAKEIVSKTVSIDDIQRSVAEYFNLKITDILGTARPKNIAEPRMAAMYLCRKLTKHSLPEIGSSFGKNHATVINAIKKIPELCEKSEELKQGIMQIERQLTRR